MSRTGFSAGSFELTDFCLIFVPFGHYDEPEILSYAIPLICPMGADVRQFVKVTEVLNDVTTTEERILVELGSDFVTVRRLF